PSPFPYPTLFRSCGRWRRCPGRRPTPGSWPPGRPGGAVRWRRRRGSGTLGLVQSVETQVEGARGVGELANGDDVHAGGRELRDRLQADVAAGLGGGTAVDPGDGLRELGGAALNPPEAVHPGSQDWFDLVHAVDLHLDVGRVTDPAADDAQRLGDRPLPKAGGERRKVVVLHHHGVREPVAVVVATAYAHGVLLEGAQAR